LVIRGEHNVIPPGRGSEPTRPERLDQRKIKRRDVVDISTGARDPEVARSQQAETGLERLETTASRIRAEIRDRVRSGFYGSEEVISRVARRLLELFGL